MGSFNNHEDKKRREGGSQMSTIVHAREGGGIKNVHVEIFLGNLVFWLLCVDISKFILWYYEHGMGFIAKFGAYLKVILSQIHEANVQIRKHIMIVFSIKKHSNDKKGGGHECPCGHR